MVDENTRHACSAYAPLWRRRAQNTTHDTVVERCPRDVCNAALGERRCVAVAVAVAAVYESYTIPSFRGASADARAANARSRGLEYVRVVARVSRLAGPAWAATALAAQRTAGR